MYYKIHHEQVAINRNKYLSPANRTTRHSHKLAYQVPDSTKDYLKKPSSARQRGNGICYQSTSSKPHRWSLLVTDSPRGLRMGRAAGTPSTVEMPAPHCTEHGRYHCTLHPTSQLLDFLIACHPPIDKAFNLLKLFDYAEEEEANSLFLEIREIKL